MSIIYVYVFLSLVVVETSPTDTTVKAGSTALFSCFVPAAEKITWFKDGRQAVSTDYAVRLKTNRSCRLYMYMVFIYTSVKIPETSKFLKIGDGYVIAAR